jgi:hypothetical protein
MHQPPARGRKTAQGVRKARENPSRPGLRAQTVPPARIAQPSVSAEKPHVSGGGDAKTDAAGLQQGAALPISQELLELARRLAAVPAEARDALAALLGACQG